MKHAPSSQGSVALSLCGYIFWWLALFGVHLLTFAYNSYFAKFYWGFETNFLSYVVEIYIAGEIPREKFRCIALVHGVLATIHGACALLMVAGLFWHQPAWCLLRAGWCNKSMNKESVKTPRSCCELLRRMYQVFNRCWELVGVNGKFFHASIVCREVVETVVQTMQAFRMSVHLPDARLNGLFVGLLVINCWSSLVIHSRWFWQDEARRRLALLVSDCILDLMASVCVSAVIVLRYANEFGLTFDGFRPDILGDDGKLAEMLSEVQLVLVMSWTDLTMRCIYSLSKVMAVMNIKTLIRYSPKRTRVVGPCTDAEIKMTRVTSLQSYSSQYRLTVSKSSAKTYPEVVQFLKQALVPTTATSSHAVHLAFAAWGALLLILHVYAATRTPLSECTPKVHPMGGKLPSYFVVSFNCHNLGITATSEEVNREWNNFDRKTAVRLRILHCPGFEMPESFRDFYQLQEIEIYNSTIARWEAETAVTNANHPKALSFTAVRVNMTGERVPLGLQSPDFPMYLDQIIFCESNLRELPNDIDAKWHASSSIFVENSLLCVVPPALIRLRPYYLALGGNPITEVPPELFEIDGMVGLNLRRTTISALPQYVPHPTESTTLIDVTQTSVSFFWPWMDVLLQLQFQLLPKLLAGGSPYCSDLEVIMSDTSGTFSEPPSAEYSPFLMNWSESNWDLLLQVVDCTPPSTTTDFPLDDWDQRYSLVDD